MRDDADEAMRWLVQAEDELNDARLLAGQDRFYLALYLSQQSAEKALKAYLYSKGVGPVLTHSVTALLKVASEPDGAFEKVGPAKRFDDYYIPTRYPNGLPGGVPSRYFDDPQETKEAISMSQSIIALVRQRVPKMTG